MRVYNALHRYWGPAALALLSIVLPAGYLVGALAWATHISLDRRVGYRLRTPDDYGLPVGALANPVCGALGPEVIRGLGSPTTSPALGMWRQRGRLGLHDMSWSGQSNGFGRSRQLALLEGLERHAGSLARQNRVEAGAGTLPTDRAQFGVLVGGTVLLVAALTFFPALALGPLAEALS